MFPNATRKKTGACMSDGAIRIHEISLCYCPSHMQCTFFCLCRYEPSHETIQKAMPVRTLGAVPGKERWPGPSQVQEADSEEAAAHGRVMAVPASPERSAEG